MTKATALPKPGKFNRFKLPDSFDGIRFELGRWFKMIQEARKSPVMIEMARKIAEVALSQVAPSTDEASDRLILKGIHGWGNASFVHVGHPTGNIEVIQTPQRMLRLLKIPVELHRAIARPIARALRKDVEAPKITGTSGDAAILALSLAAAAGVRGLHLVFGGTDGTLHYAWAMSRWGKEIHVDLLNPTFNAHPPFENIEKVEIPF